MHPVRRWLGIWLILGSALAGCNATTTVGGFPGHGATPVPTPTPTPPGATASPTARATATPTVPATASPTATAQMTATPTPAGSPTAPATATPTAPATATPSPAPSGATPKPTPTVSGATPTPNPTATPTAKATATPTAVPTPTPVATATPTPRATATPTPVATASPTARATATPTPTASPTPLPAGVKIYVANHGKVGNAPSVTIYPVAATGDATPLATLAGSATTMQQIQFPAVDASGDLFLSDQGASGSATAGFVSTFAVQHDFGNVAPQSALTGLPDPEGIAFDAEGNVYVATETAILVYPPHPTPASTPLRSITGYYADQPAPYGLTVGPTGKLYVADEQEIDVFPAGASGNALPSQVIGGSNQAAASAINSCLSVALDTGGDIYCANFNNSTITEYAPNANGNATTPMMIASDPTKTSIDEPFAIFIDASNNVYVANYGNSSISIFTTSSLATGQATRRIVGAQTGLNFPYGLWVR